MRRLSNKLTYGCLIGLGRRVSYQPQFTITPALLARVEQIAALRRSRSRRDSASCRRKPVVTRILRGRVSDSGCQQDGGDETGRRLSHGIEFIPPAPFGCRQLVSSSLIV